MSNASSINFTKFSPGFGNFTMFSPGFGNFTKFSPCFLQVSTKFSQYFRQVFTVFSRFYFTKFPPSFKWQEGSWFPKKRCFPFHVIAKSVRSVLSVFPKAQNAK